MTEQTPINQTASEERLIEELTGATVPPDVPEDDDPVRPGDPEPTPDEDHH